MNNSSISNNSNQTTNNIGSKSSALNALTNTVKLHGKRKCDFPDDNKMSKKQKVSASTKREVGSSFNQITTKVSKTSASVNNLHVHSKSHTLKGNSSKTNFKEGFRSNSVNLNLKKLLERERNLEMNLKKKNAQIEENKTKIQAEMERKKIFEAEIEDLHKTLAEFRLLNKNKKATIADNNAKLLAARECLNINLEKTHHVLEEINTKKIHLQSKLQIKTEEINEEEVKHEELAKREREVEMMKTNISFDIIKMDEEIKVIERKQRLVNGDLEKMIAKKDEYYKNKLEAMSQILILKPFYKKFCVIRNYQPFTNYSGILKVHKNRKQLNLVNHNTDDTILKFDYICSLFDNIYEEVNYCKEASYLNEEMINFLMSYLIKMNQVNDERNFLVLYLTHTFHVNMNDENTVTSFKFCNNIIPILQELINRISHFNEYTFQVKVITGDEFVNVSKEINFNYNFKFYINPLEIEKSVFDFYDKVLRESGKNIIGMSFIIKNQKNNSKFRLLNLSYNQSNIATNLISKLNEINVSKKKREKSSKKKKTSKDIHFILDEIQFIDNFFFATILDFPVEELNENQHNLKEVLLNF